MSTRSAPSRGDAIWITLNPQAGHEEAGRRPAVVISSLPYNRKVGLALCCPITGQVKGYPFEVAIPKGVPVSGVVLSDQVRNLDWKARDAQLICRLPAAVTSEVLRKLATLVSQDEP